jgi:hypothetical protein
MRFIRHSLLSPGGKKLETSRSGRRSPHTSRARETPSFLETNYIRFKGLSLLDLFDLIFDKALLEIIATKSDKYPWPRWGMS